MFPRVAIVLAALLAAGCDLADMRSELVASGFNFPVYLTSEPEDSSRLYVIENVVGRVRLVVDGSLLPTPFLDIGSKVDSRELEQGLFCIAFHPGYAQNGRFFVSYTTFGDNLIVEEYAVSSDPDVADEQSAKIILNIPEPSFEHNAGMLAFGPKDGYLYVSVGDGGFSLIPLGNAQDLSTPLGSILRIDVDNGDPFSIPEDNPFVDVEGANPAIWAYGLRNPWRFSFDRETGDMYIADVGQFAKEEVNFQPFDSPGGENYGWPIAEGFGCIGGSGDCGSNAGFTPPVYDYGEVLQVQSITGGYVYRGSAIPELRGQYLFSDFVIAEFYSFRMEEGNLVDFEDRSLELRPPQPLLRYVGVPSFGEDADGELYIVDSGGSIYKIVPANPEIDMLKKALGGLLRK